MNEFHSSSLVFCGSTDPPSTYDSAQFIVVPVPYDHTCTYGTGARFGPRAILEASANIELYDEVLGWEPYHVGIWTLESIEPVVTGPEQMISRVRSVVGKILDTRKIPILLGGEHSLSLGAVEACVERDPALSVLVIDAHADLRAEYQGSPCSHACVQRRFLELGCPVVQVGVRSLSAEEAEYREETGSLLSISVRDYRERGLLPNNQLEGSILNHLTDRIYVSIDLDGLDPSIMPATGTPEPGGLLWDEIWEILNKVCTQRTVIGADLVELQPIPGMNAPQVLAARLAYRLMGLIADGNRKGG
ncbi:MAG: agmatinase [bacterium]